MICSVVNRIISATTINRIKFYKIYGKWELRYKLRYLRPAVLGRGRAAAPPRGPAHTLAAPESPVSMSASLFGSTTVGMSRRESLQKLPRRKSLQEIARNGSGPNEMQALVVRARYTSHASIAYMGYGDRGHHRLMKLKTCCRF